MLTPKSRPGSAAHLVQAFGHGDSIELNHDLPFVEVIPLLRFPTSCQQIFYSVVEERLEVCTQWMWQHQGVMSFLLIDRYRWRIRFNQPPNGTIPFEQFRICALNAASKVLDGRFRCKKWWRSNRFDLRSMLCTRVETTAPQKIRTRYQPFHFIAQNCKWVEAIQSKDIALWVFWI